VFNFTLYTNKSNYEAKFAGIFQAKFLLKQYFRTANPLQGTRGPLDPYYFGNLTGASEKKGLNLTISAFLKGLTG